MTVTQSAREAALSLFGGDEEPPLEAGPVAVGMEVRVASLGTSGRLLALDAGRGEAEVEVKGKRLKVAAAALSPAPAGRAVPVRTAALASNRPATPPTPSLRSRRHGGSRARRPARRRSPARRGEGDQRRAPLGQGGAAPRSRPRHGAPRGGRARVPPNPSRGRVVSLGRRRRKAARRSRSRGWMSEPVYDITDDVKRDVLAATDLVQLVGTTTSLKKAGRSWKGLCPFHGEKTAFLSRASRQGLLLLLRMRRQGRRDHVRERDRAPRVSRGRRLPRAPRRHHAPDAPERHARGPRERDAGGRGARPGGRFFPREPRSARGRQGAPRQSAASRSRTLARTASARPSTRGTR